MQTLKTAPSSTSSEQSFVRINTFSLFVLHLVPGLLIFTAYRLAAPVLVGASMPPKLTLLLAFFFLGLPLQIVVLARYAGGWKPGTLWQSLSFRNKVPRWQFTVGVAGLFVWAVLATTLLAPVTVALKSWLATHAPFLITNLPAMQAARTLTFGVLIVKLFVDGLITPVIEESYFRGLVLPNMSRLGGWAPLLNSSLFTLGHFWQPENYPVSFATRWDWHIWRGGNAIS